MAGGAIITGTADISRVEAPVTIKAYLICAFAAFGGIFFGYDTVKTAQSPRAASVSALFWSLTHP